MAAAPLPSGFVTSRHSPSFGGTCCTHHIVQPPAVWSSRTFPPPPHGRVCSFKFSHQTERSEPSGMK